MSARLYTRSTTRETIGWSSAPIVAPARPRLRLRTVALIGAFLLGLLCGIAI